MFIDSILRRSDMETAHGAATPLDAKVKIDLAAEEDDGEVDAKSCQAIVGSRMYIAHATRPANSFAVAAPSRYNSRPFARHLTAAQRVLWYLKVTNDYRLRCNATGPDTLIGYTDSESASDSADRKSLGGHLFISNDTIFWQSRKQDLVATSTSEAEYIPRLEASREGRWRRQLGKDTKRNNDNDNYDNKRLPILCDNEGALTHIINGTIMAQMKHIEVCYHNHRDLHERGIVQYSWVSTQNKVADIFTKALPREKHDKIMKAMRL